MLLNERGQEVYGTYIVSLKKILIWGKWAILGLKWHILITLDPL